MTEVYDHAVSILEASPPGRSGRDGQANRVHARRTNGAGGEGNEDGSERPASNARSLEALKKRLEALPEIRRGQVESLRRAIAEGTFAITDEELAHAILSELQSLEFDES